MLKANVLKEKYLYHFEDVGDDPKLSCNPIRIFLLGTKWLTSNITPRENEELINNLLYSRERIQDLLHK